MSKSIEYLNHPAAKSAFEKNSSVYRKAEITQLMLPAESQIGKDFDTFVKDGDSVRKESTNCIQRHDIIARNPNPIGLNPMGDNIYNEWLVPSETVRKNYGDDVIKQLMQTDGFTNHQKKATIKAVLLTQHLAEAITGEPGASELKIKVSWSDEPMIARVGDVITDQGYSISAHDMQAYVLVEEEKSNTAQAKLSREVDSPSLG